MTFIYTLPELVNIGALLCLSLFMFALLGTNLYPYIKWGDGVMEGINFSTFELSFWTLFKCAGGENWNLVMLDTARQIQPNDVCYNINTYQDYLQYGLNGCGNISAYFFHIAY